MNKVLATFVLALTTAIMAQDSASAQTPASQPSATTQPGQDQSAPKNKQIQDPAEYNAYIAAYNTQDPAQKAAAMMAFLNQYPKSIVRMDALEQAMSGYQLSNNAPKVMEIAKIILQENPNALPKLAIVTAIDRAQATASANPTALKEACDDAQKGLQALPTWAKPEGLEQAEYEKQKKQIADIFYGASAFCALQNKDYAGAKSNYLKAIELEPSNLQDVYQLAISELEPNPMDLNGLWYGAKAINLAGANAQ